MNKNNLPTNEDFIGIAKQTAYAMAAKIGLKMWEVREFADAVQFVFSPYGNVLFPTYTLEYQKEECRMVLTDISTDDDDVSREIYSQCYHLARGLGISKLSVPNSNRLDYAVSRGFKQEDDKYYTLEVEFAKYVLRNRYKY